ncbi:hypothetical protein EF888_17680 [Silicimonas algicola]|uniref:Transferrin-binding protein B C-lobe/N-lobe beta-barrel domain-containing protein n=1 Tax=Silicimonas algicola TaxID=1826607 RepID=A0A316G8T3_9RHOB|nr:transferrin-binding protein-like solute binding protein [Silicimonas algicola]AZQ68800.1 hypothetical protein EF888_17680 [Silicimonas algicola]PWK56120.1 hypothetical protein C8D95_105186 [Silicimonas algicola]
MTCKALIPGLLALATLSGCSGGGGGAVYADGPSPASIDEIVGLQFPLRSARLTSDDGFTTANAGLSTYTIEFTSGTTANLTTPAGTVELTDGGGMNFTGSLNGSDYFLTSLGWGHDFLEGLGLEVTDGMGNVLVATGVFGLETRPEDVPEAAVVANFLGGSELHGTVNDVPFFDTGAANLTADFGAQTVGGNVFVGGGTTLAFDGPVPIVGNTFSGDLEIFSATATLNEGTATGRFYGDAAQVVAGTYSGSATEAGSDVDFAGVFHAD